MEVNILFASMSEVQNTILGFMIVQIRGETADINAAVRYLGEAGVRLSDV